VSKCQLLLTSLKMEEVAGDSQPTTDSVNLVPLGCDIEDSSASASGLTATDICSQLSSKASEEQRAAEVCLDQGVRSGCESEDVVEASSQASTQGHNPASECLLISAAEVAELSVDGDRPGTASAQSDSETQCKAAAESSACEPAEVAIDGINPALELNSTSAPSRPADGNTKRRKIASRSLKPVGRKEVPGFEALGLHVAVCDKKLPKTQSWCFVPLIYSALGYVPERLRRRDDIASHDQIASAQSVWQELFSSWDAWREELRDVIRRYGCERFEDDFLPRGDGGMKGWSTSLVYGDPQGFGRLPHPPGRRQDAVLELLSCDTQNQIFASILTITAVS